MKLIKLNCSACGAAISIPDDVDRLTCSACGTFLMLERGEGYYALKAVEQIANVIQESGKSTQDAIRDSAAITRKEFQRLQISQNLNTINSQLHDNQAEQRNLSRSGITTPQMLYSHQQLLLEELNLHDQKRKALIELETLDGVPLEKNMPLLEKLLESCAHCTSFAPKLQPLPKNKAVVQKLYSDQAMFKKCYDQLHLEMRRTAIKSYQIKPPFSQDIAEIARLIHTTQADLAALQKQPPTPENQVLTKELSALQIHLANNLRKEVHQQSWGEINPSAKPAANYESTHAYLTALRKEMAHLAAAPMPNSQIKAELKQLSAAEKGYAKQHNTLAEGIRIKDALGVLRTSLLAFSFARPLGSNISETQTRLAQIQSDMNTLKARPASPEVVSARQELQEKYNEHYQHWETLQIKEIEAQLEAAAVKPPFPTDFQQANEQYQALSRDIARLKPLQKIPTLAKWLTGALTMQKSLYQHLVQLRQQMDKTSELPPPS